MSLVYWNLLIQQLLPFILPWSNFTICILEWRAKKLSIMSGVALLNALSSTFVIPFSPCQYFCDPNIKIIVYQKTMVQIGWQKKWFNWLFLWNFTKYECITIDQSLQMYIPTKANDFMLDLDPISFWKKHQSLILHSGNWPPLYSKLKDMLHQ